MDVGDAGRSGAVIRGRLPGVDLLRGLAAIGVMICHYSRVVQAYFDPGFPILWPGDWGVEVFFAISGYVILMTAHRSRGRRAFLWARFVRLAPAFYVCLAMTTAAVIAEGARPTAAWLLNLTMVPVWFGTPMVEGVYWTLGYEIAFYAVVCACLPWIKRGWTLRLCAIWSPVLLWQPVVSYFVFGVVIHELTRRTVPQRPEAMSDADRKTLRSARRDTLSQVCLWAGAISYPLYLIHLTIGGTLLMLLARVLGVPSALALTVAAMLGLAHCINRYIEKPVQAALKSGIAWQPRGIGAMMSALAIGRGLMQRVYRRG